MRALIGLLAATVLATVAASAARAGDLTVTVKTTKGQPVRDAVVTVYPAGGTGAAPIHFDWPYRLAQQNLQFDPFVLVVPVGASVSFPNRDSVRHQVYSFSPTHPFELKLYGKDESRSVRFDKVGIVAVGCNIHDNMVAFIKVVDTPFAAKSDASGVAVIHDAPAGAATLRVWHPYLKAAANELSQTISVPHEGAARQSVTVDLRSPPAMHMSY